MGGRVAGQVDEGRQFLEGSIAEEEFVDDPKTVGIAKRGVESSAVRNVHRSHDIDSIIAESIADPVEAG